MKNAMNMTSIVILNYNTCNLLQQCIQSIRHCTKKGSYEIIVVDNGSSDGSVAWILSQPDIKPIINAENMGFPKGCNQGMEIAKGTEILLLNSDVVVTPFWLDNMLDALYLDEKIGAVGCVTNYCANNQQIKVPAELHNNINAIMAFGKAYNQKRPQRISYRRSLVGFCYLLKTKIFQEIGGLDERFSPGNFEDDDYSLRILLAGYHLLCCMDTFIYHVGSASFVKSPESLEKYKTLFYTNEKKFLEKWHLSKNYLSMEPEEIISVIKNQKYEKALSVVIGIPIYKETLTPCEEISLKQVLKVLGKYPIVFIAPEGLMPDYVSVVDNAKIEYFSKEYFTGVTSYSRLCLEDDFYNRFANYEYLLIHQLDAFVFEDKLPYFCALGFDYIGAPIPKFYSTWHILINSQVGNGGLSLRKISSMRRMVKQKYKILNDHPLKNWFIYCEDMFFAYCGKKNHLIIADVDTAVRFALQDNVKHAFEKLDKQLPFGVHGWPSKINIWRDYIEKEGYKLPVKISKRHADCRFEAVQDYLKGRGKVNLFYLYKAIKWDRPIRALNLVLAWLEKYPKGHINWENTGAGLMCIWSLCYLQAYKTEEEKKYNYELLHYTIGKAFIRSYYSMTFEKYPINYLAFMRNLFTKQMMVDDLSKEVNILIDDIMIYLETRGYAEQANEYRMVKNMLLNNGLEEYRNV